MFEYYIKYLDAHMRYHDSLKGDKAIIFIHGLGCAGSFDFPQMVLENDLKNYRLIFVDLLGAGYSDGPLHFNFKVKPHAKYLSDFVKHLKLKDFVIFGHSLGGAVAIELANMCINNVSQLILAEGNLDPSTKDMTSYKVASYEEEDFVEYGFDYMVNRSFEKGNTMWSTTLSKCLPEAIYRMSQNAKLGSYMSWRQMFYDLPIKKSYLYGEYSLPNDNYITLKNHGINMYVVSGAGHNMAWDNPMELSKVIAKILK